MNYDRSIYSCSLIQKTIDNLLPALVQDAGSGSVNTVLAYGADRGGVQDSTEAFQKAFNECKSVYIPEGTYRITKTITIPSRCKVIEGAGMSNTIIQYSGADEVCFDMQTSSDYSRLRGLTVTNVPYQSRKLTEKKNIAVKASRSHTRFQDLNIEHFEIGLDLCYRSWACGVYDCMLQNNKIGIRGGSERDGATDKGAFNNVTVNNCCLHTNYIGLKVVNGGNTIHVVNCDVENNTYAFQFVAQARSRIESCYFENNDDIVFFSTPQANGLYDFVNNYVELKKSTQKFGTIQLSGSDWKNYTNGKCVLTNNTFLHDVTERVTNQTSISAIKTACSDVFNNFICYTKKDLGGTTELSVSEAKLSIPESCIENNQYLIHGKTTTSSVPFTDAVETPTFDSFIKPHTQPV